MISREEKNKVFVDEIKKEQAIKISKIILKVLGIVILCFTLIFLYIYFIGPRGLKTNEFVINDSSIPNNFSGIKVLHFSDILYGSTINKDNIEKLSKEIKLINPDIVFFTGNIINEEYEIEEDEIKSLNEFFKNIPYTIGKYSVSGDIDTSTFNLITENTNFIVLNNEIIDVYNDKEKINIIGIDKNNEKKEIKKTDNYTITIINNYDDYEEYNLTSNLVLSGHNLGGELRLFGLPIVGTDKYLNKYYEENNTKIYISSGLGTKHHIRFMNKPSINVYRLYNK